MPLVLHLVGTSAPIEKICSILNDMRSDNRSKMLEQNVKTIITSKKKSTVFSSCDFYEKTKSNKAFLKKVLSTEKYDWPNI